MENLFDDEDITQEYIIEGDSISPKRYREDEDTIKHFYNFLEKEAFNILSEEEDFDTEIKVIYG
ncbi:MAG: hypothetical protein Q8P81_03500 [Nanoarchaeota archaeon]|nr:hypothetical protein [Nanoarchaeota archaeon]